MAPRADAAEGQLLPRHGVLFTARPPAQLRSEMVVTQVCLADLLGKTNRDTTETDGSKTGMNARASWGSRFT